MLMNTFNIIFLNMHCLERSVLSPFTTESRDSRANLAIASFAITVTVYREYNARISRLWRLRYLK